MLTNKFGENAALRGRGRGPWIVQVSFRVEGVRERRRGDGEVEEVLGGEGGIS